MSSLDNIKIYMPGVFRRYRLDAGLSQQDLAEACGMVKSYVGAIELGYRAPNLHVLCNLARALKVRPGEIVDAMFEAMEKGEVPPRESGRVRRKKNDTPRT